MTSPKTHRTLSFMAHSSDKKAAAVLLSGGIDSSVLIGEMCEKFAPVFPIFIRGGLFWEKVELDHVRLCLKSLHRTEVKSLVILDEPVADLYGDHWSTTDTKVPDSQTQDEAVYLPGRNLFLISKAAVWCVLHGVDTLALGTLQSNPFPDSTPEFYQVLERLVHLALSTPLQIIRPFEKMTKAEVIRLGKSLPLEHTFSCLSPVNSSHCGQCNKCAERRRGFEKAGMADPTSYAGSILVR